MGCTTRAGSIPAWFSRRSPAAAVRWLTVGALALATPGCVVRRDLYDEARAQIQREREQGEKARAEVKRARAEAQSARAEAAQRSAQVAALEQEAARLADDLRARDMRLSEAATAEAGLMRQLDELALLNAELSERLRSAGQSVEQLASERGSLSAALADTRAKLDELRRKHAAAEARAAELRELAARLDGLASARKIRVMLRDEQVRIELSGDLLFDVGKVQLKPAGRAVLAEIAGVLRTMPGRAFQVAAHTDDDRKAKSARFPTSWELSAAQAVAVVRQLVQGGMSPQSLSATGYGEFAPVGPNVTREGKARNRRVEIALVPEREEGMKAPVAPEAGKVP